MSLFQDFHAVEKEHRGAVFTWYNPGGNPGIVAPRNQTNYDLWGITPWVRALSEGLAGIESQGKLFLRVRCSPRWPVTGVTQAAATAHFPASEAYFAWFALQPIESSVYVNLQAEIKGTRCMNVRLSKIP